MKCATKIKYYQTKCVKCDYHYKFSYNISFTEDILVLVHSMLKSSFTYSNHFRWAKGKPLDFLPSAYKDIFQISHS